MAIEEVVEEVAENFDELAEATRSINTTALGYFFVGVGVGAAIGFYLGYRFNREKIKAEVFKKSEEEVEKIRELYQQRVIAAAPKPSVDEVIEERGYGHSQVTEPPRPLPAPVPISAPPVREQDQGWDYPEEIQARTPDAPYVIHQDEFNSEDPNEGGFEYEHVTYIYYAGDDVLCEEDNTPLPHADIIVGQDNLKFGHGADDSEVVYVRNDRLQLEMEICRDLRSYAEEVLGLESDESN